MDRIEQTRNEFRILIGKCFDKSPFGMSKKREELGE
jgi:hypothetical protein